MKKLMKFENSDIQMIQINGIWYFELYSIGMALGQFRIAKGKKYPAKDRIDKNAKNAEIKPVVRNAQPFITEEQLYDLMLETRTDKCRVFRKWLTNEVLPALNHEGTYTMKHEPKPTKPYEYFDKTYNGVPVLTALDVEKLTGVSATMVDYYMKHKAEHGKDYYQLTNTNLRNFKLENPRIVKFINCLNIITREGFIKFCRAYGVQIDTPKCFEVKEEPKISTVHRIYDTFCKHYNIKRYQLTEDAAKILKCGENGITNESCILRKTDSDEYKIFTDPTMPLLERQFMITENLGRIMAGQLRENANPDINYDQEARLFGIVVMAMSLFFDK
jgi:prophage antirepressor-like protein